MSFFRNWLLIVAHIFWLFGANFEAVSKGKSIRGKSVQYVTKKYFPIIAINKSLVTCVTPTDKKAIETYRTRQANDHPGYIYILWPENLRQVK